MEEIAYRFFFHNSDDQFKSNMVCILYEKYGLGQNLYTYGMLMVKTEGTRTPWRPRLRRKDNIKGIGIIPVVFHGGEWDTRDSAPVNFNLDIT